MNDSFNISSYNTITLALLFILNLTLIYKEQGTAQL
jgi:hypothetical protein